MRKLRDIPNSNWFVKEAKSIRGIPDIIGCISGRFIALEVKRSLAEARGSTGRIALQKKFVADTNKTGGYGTFIYPENESEILEILCAISNAAITHRGSV